MVKWRTMSSRCAGRSMPAMSLFWLESVGLFSSACDPGDRDGRRVLPLQVVHGLGADGTDAGLVVARRDEKLVRVEEPLSALALLDLARVFPGVVVATELVDGARQRLGNRRALALDDHYGNAVDEERDVRADRALDIPPGQSTLNWLTAVNVFRFRVWSQSMKCTVLSRPWSQSGRPSTVSPSRRSRCPPVRFRQPRVANAFEGAYCLCDAAGVEPGLSSRRLMRLRAFARSSLMRTSRKLSRPVTDG